MIRSWCLVLSLLPFAALLHATLAPMDVNSSLSAISKPLYDISTSLLTAHRHDYSPALYHSLLDMESSAWQLMTCMVLLWTVIELFFYMHYVATHKRLQTTTKAASTTTDEQRNQIYKACFDTVDDLEAWSVGWFYHKHDMSHPHFNRIHRQNIALWFAWAYWDKHLDDVLVDPKWASQLEWMIDTVEAKYHVRFPVGLNPDIECVRLSLDPLQAIHRPFVFYLGIYLFVTLFDVCMLKWRWQFQRYGDYSTVWGGILSRVHQCFIWLGSCLAGQECLRPSASSDKHDRQLVYWYRPTTTSHLRRQSVATGTKTPLVFMHGIGAGPSFYFVLISDLAALNRPLFVVEMPFATMRMVEKGPEAYDTAIGIKNMLKTHGFDKAVFVSHSFGTVATTWVKNIIPSALAGAVMIDPVCFLQNHAHVCFNFVHRAPKRLFQYLIFYFAARELYIIHYFSRLFRWQQGTFFVDPTSADNMTVFLSEKDGVTDSSLVAKYLAKSGVDHQVMLHLEHGEFLMNWTWRKRILDKVDRVARRIDDEGVEL